MIVCSCFAVTDRDLRATLRAARQGKAVLLLAGTGCGCCLETLIEIMREEAEAVESAAAGGDQPCKGGPHPP